MDYLYYLFVILGFLAVVLFLEGVYLTWDSYRGPEAKRIEKRLRAMSAGAGGEHASQLMKQRLLAETPALERVLLSVPRIHHLDRMLVQSGLQVSVARFIGIALLAIAAGLALGSFLHLPLYAVMAVGVATGSMPWLYVQRDTS